MVNECADPAARAVFTTMCVVNKSALVLKIADIGAAVEVEDGRFAINFDFLRRGVLEPSILPNVLDVALTRLSDDFSCDDLIKLLHISVTLPAFRLLYVYSKICPENVRPINPGWIEQIADYNQINALRPQRINMTGMGPKRFGCSQPSIAPVLDAVCRKFMIDRPFFVCTNENQESVHPHSLPGPFYYTPVAKYQDTLIQTEFGVGGQSMCVCDIPLPAYYNHEMWGTMDSLAAANHRQSYPYLPHGSPKVPTALERHISVQHFPAYMPATIRGTMVGDRKIAYTDAVQTNRK